MEASLCCSCHKPKATLECGLCQRATCKKCAQILQPGSFSFLDRIPEELTHRTYCGFCFDEKVAAALQTYNRCLARARGVFIFDRKKSEETRLLRRSEKPLRVASCPDREETILRLAFQAAKADFNALVDVDLVCEKVRNAGYQTSRWHGTGIPTRVDAEKLERESR